MRHYIPMHGMEERSNYEKRHSRMGDRWLHRCLYGEATSNAYADRRPRTIGSNLLWTLLWTSWTKRRGRTGWIWTNGTIQSEKSTICKFTWSKLHDGDTSTEASAGYGSLLHLPRWKRQDCNLRGSEECMAGSDCTSANYLWYTSHLLRRLSVWSHDLLGHCRGWDGVQTTTYPQSGPCAPSKGSTERHSGCRVGYFDFGVWTIVMGTDAHTVQKGQYTQMCSISQRTLGARLSTRESTTWRLRTDRDPNQEHRPSAGRTHPYWGWTGIDATKDCILATQAEYKINKTRRAGWHTKRAGQQKVSSTWTASRRLLANGYYLHLDVCALPHDLTKPDQETYKATPSSTNCQ